MDGETLRARELPSRSLVDNVGDAVALPGQTTETRHAS
jgi:hypothetical protein